MGGAVFIMSVMVFSLKGNQVELAVTNATFCHQHIGKLPDLGRGAFQNHRFKAIIVIKMAVHGRYRQIMMIMLQTG